MADTGWKSPTATGDNYNQWSFADNAYVSDDLYAQGGKLFSNQDYYDFGFSIPSGNIIDGIEVVVEAQDSGNGAGSLDIRLSPDGGSSYTSYKTQAVDDSGVDKNYTYGGLSDTWGRSWSISDFSNANFRLHIKDAGNNYGMSVDHIQIKVYYSEDLGTIANAGVSSSTTSSPSPSILGKASTSQSSDAVLLSSPSVSTAIGVNVSANSDEISLTNLSPSLSAGVNLGVSVQESVLSSTAVLASGKAITSPSTDAVLFTSLSPSLIAGIGVNVTSDEILLSSLSPSLNVSADISVDEVSLTSLGIDSFSVSKDLTAIAFSIVNPVVSVDWDYLFINKPKNITNWSSKSKNSTTWIKRPKVLTNWEEI